MEPGELLIKDIDDEYYDSVREDNIYYYYFKLNEETEKQDIGTLTQKLCDNEEKSRMD